MGLSSRGASWLRLVQAVHAIEAGVERALSLRYGVGLSEFRALQNLAAARGHELRMQDLAGRLQLNQSSVTRLVERMERSGLTIRDVCPDDKRGVYTVVTQAGLARLAEAEPYYEELLATALAEHRPCAVMDELEACSAASLTPPAPSPPPRGRPGGRTASSARR